MRRIRKKYRGGASRRQAHPDNGTDVFNPPYADDIWWGFIEDDELDWACGGPPPAVIAGGHHGKKTRG